MKSPLERKPNPNPKPALSRPFPLGDLAGAAQAEIRDGDFRTYVLLCQLAWQEHGEGEAPYTECSLAQLAALHPQDLSPETMRGRLQRLVKAGLVVRERVGRTTWRTYPLLEGAPDRASSTCPGGVTASPGPGEPGQPGPRLEDFVPDRAPSIRSCPVTASPEPGELGRSGHRPEGVAPDRAPRSHPGGVTGHTVPGQEARLLDGRAPGARPSPLAASPGPTQVGSAPPDRAGSARPGAASAPRARPRASDLTDPERNKGWDALEPWTREPEEDHLDRQALVLALTQLGPEPMNWEGIQECVIEPELAWAWYRYVQERGSQVLNAAAYIRHGVRSGRFPPGHRRRIPATPTRHPLDVDRYPYLTPSIPEERSHERRTRETLVAGVPQGSAGWPLDVG